MVAEQVLLVVPGGSCMLPLQAIPGRREELTRVPFIPDTALPSSDS